MIPRSVTLTRQLGSSQWLTDSLPCANRQQIAALATFMPVGFDAYVRVLHPAGFRPARSGVADPADALRWADLAAANGVQLDPEIAFQQLLRPSDLSRLGELEPMSGALVPPYCSALTSLLSRHTGTPAACWFCLWEGNGGLWDHAQWHVDHDTQSASQPGGHAPNPSSRDKLLASYPKVDMRLRRYFLGHGPLEAACFLYDEIGATPNIWWPEDRAWTVATEVDSYSTYIGCTGAAAKDILESADLEAIEVPLSARIDPGDGGPLV
jgi:hypothetical protein